MVNSWTRRVSIQTVPGDGIWQMHIQVRRFAYEILRVWWLVAGSRMCVQRSRFSRSSYPSRTDSLGKMKEVCPASKPTVLLKVGPGQSFSDVGGSSYETNGRWTNGTSVYFVGSIPCQLFYHGAVRDANMRTVILAVITNIINMTTYSQNRMPLPRRRPRLLASAAAAAAPASTEP